MKIMGIIAPPVCRATNLLVDVTIQSTGMKQLAMVIPTRKVISLVMCASQKNKWEYKYVHSIEPNSFQRDATDHTSACCHSEVARASGGNGEHRMTKATWKPLKEQFRDKGRKLLTFLISKNTVLLYRQEGLHCPGWFSHMMSTGKKYIYCLYIPRLDFILHGCY